MTRSPIRLGSMLFTLVDPWKGHEVAYNRWYERDHFYAGCMVGPGILAGRRFAATRRYKDLRDPATSPVASDPARGSYLALYWIERSLSREWGAWAAREVHRLHADGRMFEERDHVHTQMYVYRWGAFRDADGVPAELALDHPFRGLAVVAGQAAAGHERLDAWYREEHLPRALEGSSAAMCLSFTPVPVPPGAPADVPRDGDDRDRFLHLYFLDRDPADVWAAEFEAHGQTLRESGLGRLLWASPFVPTLPGTDRYTDELW